MSTIGSSTIAVTLTAAHRNVTITGTVDAYGAAGTYVSDTGTLPESDKFDAAIFGPAGATAFTIVNDGDITSNGTSAYGAGILLGSAGTITNAGTITAADGIAVFGTAKGADIINTKLINATIGFGVYLHAAGTVQNQGELIAGTLGIALGNGGKVTNSGTIKTTSQYGDGIVVAGGKADYIHNTGLIEAGRFGQAAGILLAGTGLVVNAGTIEGSGGISLRAAGTARNTGEILAGEGFGIALYAGGTVTDSGYLGAATGIFIAGGAGDVTAAGTIRAEGGIFLTDGGAVTSSASIVAIDGINLTGGLAKNSGLIKVSDNGVITQQYAATLDNTGTILAGNEGARFTAGGTIINAGLISATAYGVVLTNGGTLFDTGTIEGGSGAVYFVANASNRLIISPTATFIGTVELNGGALNFAADGKKIGTFAPEDLQILNAGSITIDTGAIWEISGTFTNGTAGILINDGTLKEGANDLIAFNGPIEGTGLIELGKNPLTVASTVAATQKLEFNGTGESLVVGDAAAFHGKIEKFAAGDTIDLIGIPLGSITGTHFAGGILTIDEAGHTIKLSFVSPASFGSDVFVLTADGQGTAITLETPAMSILGPTALPEASAPFRPGHFGAAYVRDPASVGWGPPSHPTSFEPIGPYTSNIGR